jgi:hypothetical protein
MLGTSQAGPPNVMAKWLTPLIRIRKVTGSKLGPEVVYPEGFRGFPQSSTQISGKYLKLGHGRFLLNNF